MTTVKQLLDDKGYDVWSINPGRSVYDAIKLMAEKDTGALLVVENGTMLGIITERDYARSIAVKGRTSPETPVWEIMTYPVLSVGLSDTLDTCMSLMTLNRIRHLPVTQDDRPIGMLSIGDLVKSIISEQRHTIRHLEHYIGARSQASEADRRCTSLLT